MRKLYVFLALVFIGTGMTAQDFKFEKDVINYGQVEQNSNGERTFVFTNIGKAPLIIKNVQSTCGCTVPKKPEKPIMPGEKGEIKVSYDTKRLGGFSKSIIIYSNALAGRKVIKIRGSVMKPEAVKLEKKKSMLHN